MNWHGCHKGLKSAALFAAAASLLLTGAGLPLNAAEASASTLAATPKPAPEAPSIASNITGAAIAPDGSYSAVAVTYDNGRPVFNRVKGATPAAARAAAARIPGAVKSEIDTPVKATVIDPERAYQWDLDTLKLNQLTASFDMSTQLVAVIDTGVRGSHEDFAPGTVLCAQGVDYTYEALGPCADPNGHGTHVSGTIAATSNNGLGITGMTPVRILPMRALDSGGSGSAYGVAQAITDAVDLGATVINMSLSGPYSSLYDDAVKYATDNNVVVVAAVGNNKHMGNAPQWPASSPGAIGVGATDQSNVTTYFSVSGSMVDVSAPGTNITSLHGYSDQSYATMAGTSMASPHVAAFAAMIRAKNPALTDDQVQTVITSTATDLGSPGRDNEYGYGLMNPLAALAAAPAAPTVTTATTRTVGSSHFIDVNWTAGADNGATATDFEITADATGSSPTVVETAYYTDPRPKTLFVSSGETYAVTVKAINGAGTSPASVAVNVTTSGTPPVTTPPTTTPPVTTPPTTTPPVTTPPQLPVPTSGYRFLAADGAVNTYGSAGYFGDARGQISGQAVTIASTATGNGYWIASSRGEVRTYGDAAFHGSMAGIPLNQPVINMAVTPTGNGYWLLARDGGVFSFGDARFYGSTGHIRLNQPAVGMTPTATGNGYWFVAADGGIFAFGDAAFYGSMGGTRLNKPVVGMTVSTTGGGYRMVSTLR